jgi:hypothetical protein
MLPWTAFFSTTTPSRGEGSAIVLDGFPAFSSFAISGLDVEQVEFQLRAPDQLLVAGFAAMRYSASALKTSGA